MDACDCCFLGCLCGACCATAMDHDDRHRRNSHYHSGYNQPIYVQPVTVSTQFVAPSNPNIYNTAPSGPYYYDTMGSTTTTASHYPPYGQQGPQVSTVYSSQYKY